MCSHAYEWYHGLVTVKAAKHTTVHVWEIPEQPVTSKRQPFHTMWLVFSSVLESSFFRLSEMYSVISDFNNMIKNEGESKLKFSNSENQLLELTLILNS